MSSNPFSDPIERTSLCIRRQRSGPHVDCRRMEFGGFLGLLDVYHPLHMIDCDNFSHLFIPEIHVLADTYVASLRVEGIAVGWNLFAAIHSVFETHTRKTYSLIEQVFIIRFGEPVALLPGALVFASVPAQKLCQQPLAGLLFGP